MVTFQKMIAYELTVTETWPGVSVRSGPEIPNVEQLQRKRISTALPAHRSVRVAAPVRLTPSVIAERYVTAAFHRAANTDQALPEDPFAFSGQLDPAVQAVYGQRINVSSFSTRK